MATSNTTSAVRHARDLKRPLRDAAEEALQQFFANLNGERPTALYDLVIQQIEEPLLQTVMQYTNRNQSHAAALLGINRGTLRKKLRFYGLID